MNKKQVPEHSEIPSWLKVALDFGIKKRSVLHPKIELDLLVKTTLALRSPIDPHLDASLAREEYKKLAHEAVLIIEGCQQVLSAREAMQAAVDEESARQEREQLPRTVSYADGVFKIVGDRNSGPNRGTKKLQTFLEAFYGENMFREMNTLPKEEWVSGRLTFWRKNQFNEEEVKWYRDKRNDYVVRGILEGDPVTDEIIEESACLASSDRTRRKPDKNRKKPDRRRGASRPKTR
jgi:hypothetical protein